MQAFKNIFFDLGGVLFDLHPEPAFRAFQAMGIPMSVPQGNAEEALRPTPESSAFIRLIHEVDLGHVRRDDFLRLIKSQCRPGVSDEEIVAAYASMISVPASRLALLKELRKTYKVFLLSNIGDIHWAAAQQMIGEAGFRVEDCLDHCFVSYELGLAKPDPAIFARVIALSGVDPSESLYIDDFQANIDAGQAAGFIAYKIATNQLEQHLPSLFPTQYDTITTQYDHIHTHND